MKILSTIGPSSLNEKTIKGLEDNGCSLFRINLSHTKIADLENVISKLREYTKVPICLDSEGAQVRTTKFNFDFKLGYQYTFTDTEDSFSIRPFSIIQQLNPGDLISIDFNTALVKVIKVLKDSIVVETVNAGKAGENKAVTIMKNVTVPAFSNKDYMAFKLGSKLGIKNYALSFASNHRFVQELRSLVPEDSYIISKIESNQGIKNLLKIIHHSDAILIDRGDLSREVSSEKIPVLQKLIISQTKHFNKDAFVATNLLESMIDNPVPNRAEINDIYNTLLDGASGLVLAAETAIGKYPVASISIVKNVINFYNSYEINNDISSKSYEEIIKKINKPTDYSYDQL
jgi:pyruvate kinase